MRSSTKRILQRGNFRDLDDPEKSVVLVKGIVRDLILDAGRDRSLTQEEVHNLAEVLIRCWWCSWWAVGVLMKETEVLDMMRPPLKGTERRERFEDLLDKLINQQDLLGGRDNFPYKHYVKPWKRSR